MPHSLGYAQLFAFLVEELWVGSDSLFSDNNQKALENAMAASIG